MPYIEQQDRDFIKMGAQVNSLSDAAYVAFRAAVKLLRLPCTDDPLAQHPTYHTRISIYGMLCGVAAEFYRRHVAPYEDKKIEENGDVY